MTQTAQEADKKAGKWRMDFDESTHAKIIRLFKAGKSQKEISDQANVDRSCVSRNLKQARRQLEI